MDRASANVKAERLNHARELLLTSYPLTAPKRLAALARGSD